MAAGDMKLNLEILMNNLDVAREMMEFLDYKDQLNMSRVCKQFENIIINYLWKSKFRQVEMIINPNKFAINTYTVDDIDVLRNDVEYARRENRFILNQLEMEEFLQVNSRNIEVLQIIATHQENDKLDLNLISPHLKSLLLYGIPLNDDDIKYVLEYCQDLRSLIFHACTNFDKDTLVIGEDIQIATLASFTNLQSFTLKPRNILNPPEPHLHKYEHIHGILSNLKAKQIRIDETIHYPFMIAIYRNGGAIRSDIQRSEPSNTEPSTPNSPCVELEVGSFRHTDDFVKFYKDFLESYVNLKKLSIEGSRCAISDICVPKQFFTDISGNCTELFKLKLKNLKINYYIPIATLTDLTLFDCKGMTWENLQLILKQTILISFTTYRTYYRGKVEPIEVTKSLRHFEFDFPERFLNTVFENQLKNLTSLTWRNTPDSCIQNIGSNFPNLENLTIVMVRRLDNSVLDLKFLTGVRIFFHVDIGALLLLLQHPTLKTLLLGAVKSKVEDAVEVKVPKTNLAFLTMTSNVFKERLDFWLDLLAINLNLSIICKGFKCNTDESIFTKLIQSSKFPNRLKYIKVGGFKIDCADLKNNFEENMEKINEIDDIMSSWALVQNIVF